MLTQRNVTIETTFHPDGQVKRRSFLVDGKNHRDPKDGPAFESFYENGQVRSREFWVGDKRSRDPKDGPAVEEFYENGQVETREFWVDGKKVLNPTPEIPDCSGQVVVVNGVEYILTRKELSDDSQA